ncbi:XRE family transcriptional regulator [Pseudomonas sp. SLFW]|uniref:XRE family transcriptional regulator n=1 Tax=Pseudomonas sp. SLFW TaxID=2683259 RepID=UPI001412CF4A|nr:XRE family transcriptional regulator [Pseudomonas sp. SLFW]NBB09523.1 XRE family transcriptional regulator [Pseudomonas sp. SLFW]
MIRIQYYQPPSAAELAQLKARLNLTSQQMADLVGLAGGSQWRKYTGGVEPRTLGQHMHFYLSALLTLDDEQLESVYACMRDHGATFDETPTLHRSQSPALD